MKRSTRGISVRAGAITLALMLGVIGGCRQQARTDQQVAGDVKAKIQSESALAGQNIQVNVAKGIVTLTGTVTDDASRALAGNDSGTVNGVKTVVNNLTVQPAQQAAVAPPPATPQSAPPPVHKLSRTHKQSHVRPTHARDQPAPQPVPEQMAQAAPPPPPVAPAAPLEPPKPVIKTVTLPAGTVLPIRITESLSSKDAQPNDVFHGSLAADVGTQGVVALRQGSAVLGRVVDAKEAAHFKGNALLSLELTQIAANGKKVPLVTDAFDKQGAGRGKNTAEKAGGGALFGAIVGALAGGGKGAAIGTLAGGAAGTGINAATRGQQVVIPTETLINFTLKSPVSITVTIPPAPGAEGASPPDPQLQRP